jgi:hypothetical protein
MTASICWSSKQRECAAADSIEELLHQDEVDGHNDALRRDLNALTEEQWQYYFEVERKQPDIELGGQLIVRESEERPHVLCCSPRTRGCPRFC